MLRISLLLVAIAITTACGDGRAATANFCGGDPSTEASQLCGCQTDPISFCRCAAAVQCKAMQQCHPESFPYRDVSECALASAETCDYEERHCDVNNDEAQACLEWLDSIGGNTCLPQYQIEWHSHCSEVLEDCNYGDGY